MGAYEGDDHTTRARSLIEARVLRGEAAARADARHVAQVRERGAGEEAGGRGRERRRRNVVAPEDGHQVVPPVVTDEDRALVLGAGEAARRADLLADLLAGADGGGGLGVAAEGLETVGVTAARALEAATAGRLETAATRGRPVAAATEGAATVEGLETAAPDRGGRGDVGLDEGHHRDDADLRGLAVRVVRHASLGLGEDELATGPRALDPGPEDGGTARFEDELVLVLGGGGPPGEDVRPVHGDDDRASAIVLARDLDGEVLTRRGADALLAVDLERVQGALAAVDLGQDGEDDVRVGHFGYSFFVVRGSPEWTRLATTVTKSEG